MNVGIRSPAEPEQRDWNDGSCIEGKLQAIFWNDDTLGSLCHEAWVEVPLEISHVQDDRWYRSYGQADEGEGGSTKVEAVPVNEEHQG